MPWNKVAEQDERYISLICDYYTANPGKAAAWRDGSLQSFIPRVAASVHETHREFVEITFTENEKRLLRKIKQATPKSVLCSVNEIEIVARHLKLILEGKLTDEVIFQ